VRAADHITTTANMTMMANDDDLQTKLGTSYSVFSFVCEIAACVASWPCFYLQFLTLFRAFSFVDHLTTYSS